MSLDVWLTPESESDLSEAKGWYDRQYPGLGQQFILCIDQAIERILLLPEGYREVVPGVRRVLVRRFPYGIYYKIEPERLVILAVYHSKRDPKGWKARVE